MTDQDWNADRTLRTIRGVNLDRGDVSIVNYGASPTTSVDARVLACLRKESNLSLYQARARASALRDRDIKLRIRQGQHVSDNPNLAYYQAQAWALGCRD